MSAFIQCPSCERALGREVLTGNPPVKCHWCGKDIYFNLFPAADLPQPPKEIGEPLITGEEAACFHHSDRKAVAVCTDCGRFLCKLCDVEINGTHYCAVCLEKIRKSGHNLQLEMKRMVYDEVVLVMSLLAWFGLVFLAPMALFLGWRHRCRPVGLLSKNAWRIWVALVLSSLNILALITLIVWLAFS